ncbi:hypothetical protein NDU88_000961 [Pleurodeles waltl]|uniref:Uncharacterized protein n=1 Tax=Pleurodeles waltl TaxID=8319 RepID=A0AAV7SA75_PLEWA|nr:hypothetical protein NDU88_000961 [Pleurodeles waltl]
MQYGLIDKDDPVYGKEYPNDDLFSRPDESPQSPSRKDPKDLVVTVMAHLPAAQRQGEEIEACGVGRSALTRIRTIQQTGLALLNKRNTVEES